MTYLVLLFLLEILCFLIFFMLNKQDIMAPSVMVVIVFLFSTFIAMLNVNNWNIEFSFNAMFLLTLGIILFGVTDIIVHNLKMQIDRTMSHPETVKTIWIEPWKIKIIIIIDFIIVVFVYREVRRIAGTDTWFSNIYYAYRMIVSHSDRRTANQYMNGLISQSMKFVIVSGFLYAYIFIHNVHVCKSKVRSNLLYVIPPIMLSIMTLMTGVRTNVLRLCIACLVYAYILLQYKSNWRIKTSWRFIQILAIASVVILISFGALQSFLGRRGSTDIFTVISVYAGGPIQQFNQYIQDKPIANQVFGQSTFVGIWNFLNKLGFIEEVYSVHAEFRKLDDMNMGNVYTIFRKFIQDFGILGMCFMTVALSAILSVFYNFKIKRQNLSYKRIILIVEYGYLYYIVTMASIDNVVHDYINIGTCLMVIILHIMCWFLFKFKIKIVL